MLQEKDEESGEIDARLVITAEEDGTSRELPIGLPNQPGEQLIIGRSRAADFVLQDPYVSGKHLSIRFEQGTHVVKDLGSTHGSTINDQALTGEHRLEPGDCLGFGHCSAVYHRRERKLASAAELLKPPPEPEPESKPEPTAEDDSAAPTPAEPQTQPTPVKPAPTEPQTEQPSPPPARRSRSMLTTLLGLIVILMVLGVLAVLGLQVFFGIDLLSDYLNTGTPS